MIYIDIDGTLTIPPKGYKFDGLLAMGKWREPWTENIEKVKRLIQEGKKVVIWSGGGYRYVKAFCKKYDIKPYAMLSKPKVCVDDNPRIKPIHKITVIDPRYFVGIDL
jgi:hydroxymethylpyrimidine pyrophosphatase-like HAD family hydrolase